MDALLDSNDKNFIEDLTKALGIKKGEKINIVTPRFERTDGRAISYYPNTKEEYKALKEMSPENLKKVGCQVWDEENGLVSWLYPHEWYMHIPDGLEIVDVMGNTETFKQGETDDDKRFGALSFGFTQQSH